MHLIKKKTEEQKPQLSNEFTEKIRIMPGNFFVGQKKSPNMLFVILMVIVILLLIVLAGLTLVFKVRNAQITSQLNNINAAQDANVNADTNAGANNAANANENIPAGNVNANANTNSYSVNINTNVNGSGAGSSALDASDIDSDGLTAEEEKALSTNANGADTDSDGYNDRDEIIAGYDPQFSQKLLVNSSIVSSTQFGGMTVLYPGKWLVQEIGTVLAIDTKKGETITIVSHNIDAIADKKKWIIEQFPDMADAGMEKITLANFSDAYKTSNGLVYFLFPRDNTHAFVATYAPLDPGSKPFLSIFLMIISNMKL